MIYNIHVFCSFKQLQIPDYFTVHVAHVENTSPASAGLPSFLARCELREAGAGKEIILWCSTQKLKIGFNHQQMVI